MRETNEQTMANLKLLGTLRHLGDPAAALTRCRTGLVYSGTHVGQTLALQPIILSQINDRSKLCFDFIQRLSTLEMEID